MNTTFELWDIDSGNVVGSFSTEEDALEVVATLLQSYGRDYARQLALGRRDGIAPLQIVSAGEELLGAEGRDAPEPVRMAKVPSR
jgi:hypothetical protein